MDCMNVYYAPVVPQVVLVIGGTMISIWVQQYYYKLIDELPIAEIIKLIKD